MKIIYDKEILNVISVYAEQVDVVEDTTITPFDENNEFRRSI